MIAVDVVLPSLIISCQLQVKFEALVCFMSEICNPSPFQRLIVNTLSGLYYKMTKEYRRLCNDPQASRQQSFEACRSFHSLQASSDSKKFIAKNVHNLTNMQFLDLTKSCLFFNIISSAVHALLLSLLQCLDSSVVQVFLLILKKVLHSNNDIISVIKVPARCFFMLGSRK